MRFTEFIQNLYRFGMEYFRRYYGPYRAIVTSNDDPEFRGRVQVECPRARLSAGNGMWLLPMQSSGSQHGEFWPPDVGSVVWVFFDNGDFEAPLCYLGGWYAKSHVHEDLRPEAGGPKKRGWRTPGGHKIILSDKDDAEEITVQHSSGKLVKITDDKVSIGNPDGSYEPLMRGETVRQWLVSHTHPHSWGPTGTPVQPFPDDGLSDDTETT